MVWVDRFRSEDVEGGAGDLAFGDGAREGVLVDDAASGRVDEQGAALHFLERRIVDHVLGLRRERCVNCQEVGAGQQLVELDQLDAELGGAIATHHRIHANDLHLETLRAVGNDASDVAQADDAERLIGDLAALELALLPLASAHRGDGLRNLSRQ